MTFDTEYNAENIYLPVAIFKLMGLKTNAHPGQNPALLPKLTLEGTKTEPNYESRVNHTVTTFLLYETC